MKKPVKSSKGIMRSTLHIVTITAVSLLFIVIIAVAGTFLYIQNKENDKAEAVKACLSGAVPQDLQQSCNNILRQEEQERAAAQRIDNETAKYRAYMDQKIQEQRNRNAIENVK